MKHTFQVMDRTELSKLSWFGFDRWVEVERLIRWCWIDCWRLEHLKNTLFESLTSWLQKIVENLENLLFTGSILSLTTQLSAQLDRWLDQEYPHHQLLFPQDRFPQPSPPPFHLYCCCCFRPWPCSSPKSKTLNIIIIIIGTTQFPLVLTGKFKCSWSHWPVGQLSLFCLQPKLKRGPNVDKETIVCD